MTCLTRHSLVNYDSCMARESESGKHTRREDTPAGFPVGEAKKDPHARDGSRKGPGHHAEDHPRNTKSDGK